MTYLFKFRVQSREYTVQCTVLRCLITSGWYTELHIALSSWTVTESVCFYTNWDVGIFKVLRIQNIKYRRVIEMKFRENIGMNLCKRELSSFSHLVFLFLIFFFAFKFGHLVFLMYKAFDSVHISTNNNGKYNSTHFSKLIEKTTPGKMNLQSF